jgi:putative nucleotide binding protein
MSDAAADEDERRAVVLDLLPNGRPDDERPQYERPAVAYAVGEDDFRLYELELVEDADVSIGDRLVVRPAERRDAVDRFRETTYADLTNAARSEVEYVVEEIVDRDERRFVDFYAEADPISLRLHQLDLLPGVGDKIRNNVLDARKRGRFESFEDVEERVSGLHDPRGVLIERILSEFRDDDLKYRLFVRPGRTDE